MHSKRNLGGLVFLLPSCAIVFFYWFVCRSFFVHGQVPGDLGDARFNIYILEHLYRWLSDLDVSLSSPAIFYPFPGTLFFSDAHFGSAIFYVLFRAKGFGEYMAFNLWFFTGYFLTFAAGYFVALRLGYGAFLSVVIATIFSFSLPSLAQLGHPQLVYRFAVPLAFLNCWSFVRTGSIKQIVWLIIWIGLEMLCSVYLGVFLALAAGVFMSSSLFVKHNWHSVSALMRDCIADARKPQGGLLMAVAVFVAVAAIAVLAEYQSWANVYGFGRSWEEVSKSLPRPSSYFIMDYLAYWKPIDDFMFPTDITGRNEQNIFMGLGVMGFFLVGSASIIAAGSKGDLLARTALITTLALVLLTTSFWNRSAYFFLFHIPGFNSIRAVARISVVLMFPVALVAAEGARALLNSVPRTPSRVVLALFLTLSVMEILMIAKPGFSINEAEHRTTAIVEEARRVAAGKPNPILSLREDWQLPYLTHLDAMFAARRLGWPTSNGYSGNGPPGYEYQLTDASLAHLFGGYEQWHAAHKIGPDVSAVSLLQRDVQVGSVACPMSNPPQASFGPPPVFNVAREIQILPVSLEREDSHLSLEVNVHYDGGQCVHASSLVPIRLSWRFVPVGYDDDKDVEKIGWDTRLQIPQDILPNRDVKMKVMANIPSKPGTYNIEFSMVAELSFWFHDRGMKILRFEDAIKVP